MGSIPQTNGLACSILIMAGDLSQSYNNVCSSGDSTCTQSGTGFWKSYTATGITFADDPSVNAFLDCTQLTAGQISHHYLIDNFVLTVEPL
ncbi:hypothetical protein BDY24DRAFT_373624 [Mrakia frigida]|uniref:uncharacterized protein n=1 Tax=Mrakia frigida TaxID=29902 RepID=UPI003FCBFF0D